METGREFLNAITEATENAFEEYSDRAAKFLDEMVAKTSQVCDAAHLIGRKRDAVIFFEGMLRGVQLQMRRRKLEAEVQAQKMNIDPASGLAKGTKVS